MNDPYTMKSRLCDDDGMVSDTPMPHSEHVFDGWPKTYLAMMNGWVGMTRRARGDKHEPITEPFTCTGHAHLIGQHIQCTSPAHSSRTYAQCVAKGKIEGAKDTGRRAGYAIMIQ